MSDRSSESIVEALRRAAREPAGLPLHGGKRAGLFSASASAKKAAQLCKSEGYLRTLRTESRGRRLQEVCALTEKGLAYLLSQVSPKPVLEDMVRALHAQQAQVGELLAAVGHWQANLDAFKAVVAKILHNGCEGSWAVGSGNGKADGTRGTSAGAGKIHAELPTPQEPSVIRQAILSHLSRWQESSASGDCPLPELYRGIDTARFTTGQFHDELRRLQEQGLIYLHPWTGPLPEIPEPVLALLAGHGIAYYASIR